MKDGALQVKSFAFAARIVKLCKYLRDEKRALVLTRQWLRSGTAVGALVREAEQAESKPDFVPKLSSPSRKPMSRNAGHFSSKKPAALALLKRNPLRLTTKNA